VSTSNTEDFQVLHYRTGQKYDNHHDWGQAGLKGYPESRYVSMLLYLSSQDSLNSGGETAFPKAMGGEHTLLIKPVKGTAVFFYNLLEDGNGDDLAVHAAETVLRGEKWIANFWVWDPKRFSNCGVRGGV
jgi:prolyl 4-hydroxylase